jgi:hypothetical protein
VTGREDPWEFEHWQQRAGRHERDWVEFYRDDTGQPGWRPPTKIEVCPQCGGRGRSSNYLGVITQDQMADDPDFYFDYMNGAYDRTCESCDGRNVVEVIDGERLTATERDSYLDFVKEAYESDAIARQEWMMGA